MIEVKGLKEEEATLNRRNFTGVGFSYFQKPWIGAWNEIENTVERRVFS